MEREGRGRCESGCVGRAAREDLDILTITRPNSSDGGGQGGYIMLLVLVFNLLRESIGKRPSSVLRDAS